ncbi:hypothetical protein [Francisella frigiditurris]|uniref:Uncharacterized protein n=1 Tax=Francisella frigiditurris TaxID=1542390 RepID=A0A1J0KUY0_9GAMM|nr:hypothetical protein [Francisella frigiditurris]APC97499.1 hypothetical protein KX01_336 [Francisella frigiditurris]
MNLRKVLISLLLLLLTIEFSYSLGNSYKSQMADMAKNYAEKKYDRKYKVERSYDNGLSVVLEEYEGTSWFTSRKVNECTVYLTNVVGTSAINANPTVPNIAGEYNVNDDSCGESIIISKIKKYIQDSLISKYYTSDKIDFSLKIRSEGEKFDTSNTRYPHSERYFQLYNVGGDWNLNGEEWLEKYKAKIQVNNMSINIYEQPENAENIAKAIEFSYELDKYLKGLTDSHKIENIYVYMTDLTPKEFEKEGGFGSNRNKDRKEYPRGKFNFYFAFIDARFLRYVPQSVKDLDKIYEYKQITSSNIFEFVRLANSNRSDMSFIKDTKYYQPVKEILASKLNSK